MAISLLKALRVYAELKAAKRSIDRYTPWYRREQKQAVRFYSQFIQAGDLCFDVGANVGKRTEVFLKLGARCVCVEPQKYCLQQLDKHFGNNVDVTIVAKALGDKEGYADMTVCEDAPSISTISDKWRNESRFSKEYGRSTIQTVAVTTLDELIAQYGLPVFCKIDVEGYEETVLSGLTSAIPCVSFEFTREFLDDSQKCISRLLSIGAAEFNFSIGESMKLLFETWVTPDELYSGIHALDNKHLQGDIYARFIQGVR